MNECAHTDVAYLKSGARCKNCKATLTPDGWKAEGRDTSPEELRSESAQRRERRLSETCPVCDGRGTFCSGCMGTGKRPGEAPSTKELDARSSAFLKRFPLATQGDLMALTDLLREVERLRSEAARPTCAKCGARMVVACANCVVDVVAPRSAEASPDRLHQHCLSLVRDALRWTEGPLTTDRFLALRDALTAAGFATMPHDATRRERDQHGDEEGQSEGRGGGAGARHPAAAHEDVGGALRGRAQGAGRGGAGAALQGTKGIRTADGVAGPSVPKVEYAFTSSWSEGDKEYVGLCVQYPSLSWLAATKDEALVGIMRVVVDVLSKSPSLAERLQDLVDTFGRGHVRQELNRGKK